MEEEKEGGGPRQAKADDENCAMRYYDDVSSPLLERFMMAPRRRCSRSIITPERPNFEQVPIFLSARWERGSVAHRDSSMWVGEWERGTPIRSPCRARYAFLPHRATMSHIWRQSLSVGPRRAAVNSLFGGIYQAGISKEI